MMGGTKENGPLSEARWAGDAIPGGVLTPNSNIGVKRRQVKPPSTPWGACP